MELITGVVSGYSDFHPVRSLLKPPRLQHARPAAKPSGGIEEDDTASADKIEFTGNIKEAFKQLGTYRDSPRNLKAAKVFLERYFGLVPHHFPTDELVCHISVALGLKPPEQREVADHAQVLYEVRRKHYIRP